MDIQPRTFKGIDFVRISDLPKEQKRVLSNGLMDVEIIKIMIDDCILKDCILFSDYVRYCANMDQRGADVIQ